MSKRGDKNVPEDKDRKERLKKLEQRIQDNRSIINVDCLLDAVQALVSDCDHPAIRKIKNIDAFVNRCKGNSVGCLSQVSSFILIFLISRCRGVGGDRTLADEDG